MKLSALQNDLHRCLRSAVEAKPNQRIVYHKEWLGYLPFGMYHWIVDATGEDISATFPSEWQWDWSAQDLEALEIAGLLTKVGEWQNPDDEFEATVTYDVMPA